MNRSCSDLVLRPNEIAVDAPLPTIQKSPTRVDVVLFCAAIRNFHRLHYDETYTKAQGIEDILIPGFMMGNWCIEAATRAFGPGARVRGLRFRNTKMAFVGDSFAVTGRIAALDADSPGIATCEIEVKNAAGELVTKGTVQVRRAN